MNARVLGLFSVAIAGVLILTSCSSGPEPPRVGSPAYYWAAARETYAAGDYQKAAEHLEALCRTDNEYVARAQPFYMILASGMAKGYMDLADYFEHGARANRGNPTPFRRQMGDFRTYASQYALQFAQTFEKFEKINKDQKIALDFEYPTGSAFPSPALEKIGSGELPQPAILDDLRRQHLKTAVVLETTRAVGAPDDTAKTQELFKTKPVQVPREVFVMELARVLHDQAQLFARAKLDQPQRLEFFASHAMDALKTVPETKETRTLMGKIQKTLKTAKAQ